MTNEELYEASQKYRERLDNSRREQDAKFDKNLLSLSAGSFGVSFAFIGQVVPMASATHIPFIVLSWACFAVSILSIVVSFRISSFIHRKLIEQENKNLALQYEGKPAEYKVKGVSVDIFNYTALTTFIGGIVCLLLFVVKNLA
ncbi:hypothetical protein FACS1894110_25360 [Spirochaetia bacterium]|nr:hypothetical protein FACS1894110_25360 [Spirochaetia bacterium]